MGAIDHITGQLSTRSIDVIPAGFAHRADQACGQEQL
jgi:hypothetical protein